MKNIIFEGTFVQLQSLEDDGHALGVTLEQDFCYEDSELLSIERCDDEDDSTEFALLYFSDKTLLIVDADYLGASVH